MPDGSVSRFGSGPAVFRVLATTQRGLDEMESLDEMRVASAYFDGDLDLEGDVLAALTLRTALTDRHPFLRFWTHRVLPFLHGQAECDKRWIRNHYEEEPAFYELFLDPKFRCYSQAQFSGPGESLETAIERKLTTAAESTMLRPGSRVLDIGAGWGAFVEFAGSRGIHVTSLTISRVSEEYVSALIARRGLPCRVVFDHFLEHRAKEPYDAIINLGVTEHLPDYPATIRQYDRLLKPGGRIYLDASASRSPVTTTATLIYSGNGRSLNLAEYVQALQDSAFDILTVCNDTDSYRRTTEAWARNLEAARARVAERFGERQYRRFRLYLWACTHALSTGSLEAYHLVLRKHGGQAEA
jgi:cyclopropane-fatty-acyl-phospholipid synthase